MDARPFSALSFRVCGSAAFEVGDMVFQSCPGNILFLPSGVNYSARYTDGESIVVHLAGCNYRQVEYYTLHNPRYLQKMFSSMLDDWRTSLRVNKVKAAIFSILHTLEEDQAQNYGDALNDCLSYIQEHFCDPELKISDLCLISGISESVLDRRFQMCFGLSPKQFILKMRLNYAIQLLTRGNDSVRNVSRLAGFRDEKYFSRIVKERFGQSPSAFLGLGPRG